MFSANPRGWRAAEPAPEAYRRFREARVACGLAPVVVHDNYLINLSSVDPVIREKSIAAFRGEVRRAIELAADYLVTHPGSYKGGTVSAALKTCAESLLRAAQGLNLDGLTILIENTAGQGSAGGGAVLKGGEIISPAPRELPEGAGVFKGHRLDRERKPLYSTHPLNPA